MNFQLQNYLRIFVILTYFDFKRLFIFFFLTKIRIIYEKPCIKFTTFLGTQHFFYRHLNKKILRKIENFSCLKVTINI